MPLIFRPTRAALVTACLGLLSLISHRSLFAADYLLTLSGGYHKTGNQASLEANVVFFQQLLADHPVAGRRHDIFFADGDDPVADLQIVAEKPGPSESPVTDLLSALHRRRGEAGEQRLDYRNHRVPEIAGALDPARIRERLEKFAETAKSGDRLLVYVTAHGSPGPRDDRFNTTIDCWNKKKITAREFTKLLDKLPAEVPVVLVMAQCYCGGFSHTLFTGLEEEQGLAPQVRAGFFAQQHDLPAAGCRPDIEHDEEFSSYFWGAFAGRTRNGVKITGVDLDGNGVVSFAEAFAYTVTAAETIDIPLRTSEVFLRTYSRLTHDNVENDDDKRPELVQLTGSIETILEGCRPVTRRIVTGLCEKLGRTLQDDVAAIRSAHDDSRRAPRAPGRRGPRSSSGRRELLREIGEKWPELNEEKWAESELLALDKQEALLKEIHELPSWKTYDERRTQSADADKESDRRELRTVKFRRLLNALEAAVLERNLPRVATPEILARYQQLLALEESGLLPPQAR